MSSGKEKEELLEQAVTTQYAILRLLENTLQNTYLYEKGLPEEEQNTDLINLTHSARNIIAKKPKLKAVYKRLEEDYGIKF